MTIQQQIEKISKGARKASYKLATADTGLKNQVLKDVAQALKDQSPYLEKENLKDIQAAEKKGLSPAMIDRLRLSSKTIDGMIQGLFEVTELPDPVGTLTQTLQRPNGLEVSKMRIPLGVIAMIYESRPNVTVDAAALCLKSGNAVILRGGSEAFHSNMALAEILKKTLQANGLPQEAVQVLPFTDREAITHLLLQEEFIDLVIPRGGEALIRFVVQNSTIPVLKHYKGVCHVYVDKQYDPTCAMDICFNSKVQRPGVCNALETLLVHQDAAKDFLPKMAHRYQEAGVRLKGCSETLKILPNIDAADETDWHAEYLELTLAVRIVSNIKEAMEHIADFGSDHTDVIVTSDNDRAEQFINQVSSSMVGINVSTRFNDGGELGLGAEIGISTSRLHAFGPMGLEELTTTKFVVKGNGQTRH